MQIINKTIDDQGRIIIPKEIREEFHIEPGDKVNFRSTEEGIEMYPVETFCVICGTPTKHKRNGVHICPECVAKLSN